MVDNANITPQAHEAVVDEVFKVASGTYTFTVPKGVSKLRCEIVGAGGGADGKSAGNNGWVIIEYGQGVQ